jgi:hypothetical protein
MDEYRFERVGIFLLLPLSKKEVLVLPFPVPCSLSRVVNMDDRTYLNEKNESMDSSGSFKLSVTRLSLYRSTSYSLLVSISILLAFR